VYSLINCLRNVPRTNLCLFYQRNCFLELFDSCVVLLLSSPCEIGVPGPGAVCVAPLVPQLHSHPLLPLHLTQVSEMTVIKRKAHCNTVETSYSKTWYSASISNYSCNVLDPDPIFQVTADPDTRSYPRPRKKMTNCNCKEA